MTDSLKLDGPVIAYQMDDLATKTYIDFRR